MSAADSAFIDDGFTFDGYLAALPGLHPAVRFQFRPLLVSERTAWLQEMDRRQDRNSATAEMLARKLVSWDLRNAKGETPNCREAATLLRLRPRLWDRLLNVVTGQEPSDPDPLRPVSPDGGAVFDQGATAKN